LKDEGEKSMDYQNWPNNDETAHTEGKAKPRKSFIRRYAWQIAAIVCALLVIWLAYANISMRFGQSAATAPTPTPSNSQSAPVAAATATPTPTPAIGATDTPTLTTTVPIQSGLPCKVNLSTWTDGSSDWKILNSALLNDGSNNNWDDKRPTIVAPCQLGNTSNYAVEVQIQVTSSNNYPCFGITLRGTPLSNDWQGYKAGVGDCFNGLNIARISGPDYSNDQQKKDATFDPTTTKHTYRVEARGNIITFFIDGGQILTMTDNRYLTGAEVGLWSKNTQLQVFSFQVTAL